MKSQVKFSDVYDCEIEKNLIFKRSKMLISLGYLLTVAFLMSFSSQAFFWGFALVIGLPVYFFLMNVIFKYYGNSKYAQKSGVYCFYGSISFILIMATLFTILYRNSYSTYFSQKYTPKWCRGYSLEKQAQSKLNYYSLTYEIYDTQEEADEESSSLKYGCGCVSQDRSKMSNEGIDGYEYIWNSQGNLQTLPFWICSKPNDNTIPELSDFQDTRRCYIYEKGNNSTQFSQKADACSNHSEFIQITLDNPPYYSSQLLLYLIGFFLLSIFGVGCNFPITFFILKFYNIPRNNTKSDYTSLDKRKVYMCYALKKVLIFDKIKEEKDALSLSPPTKKYEQNENQNIVQQEVGQQKTKVWRQEILNEVIEFLHRDPSSLVLAKLRIQQRIKKYNPQSSAQNEMRPNIGVIHQELQIVEQQQQVLPILQGENQVSHRSNQIQGSVQIELALSSQERHLPPIRQSSSIFSRSKIHPISISEIQPNQENKQFQSEINIIRSIQSEEIIDEENPQRSRSQSENKELVASQLSINKSIRQECQEVPCINNHQLSPIQNNFFSLPSERNSPQFLSLKQIGDQEESCQGQNNQEKETQCQKNDSIEK